MMKNIEKTEVTEYVNNLFKETDENGILLIRGWYYDGNDESENMHYSCEMNWNENEKDDFLKEVLNHIEMIKRIAEKTKAEQKLNEEEKGFWKKYIRPLGNSIDIYENGIDDKIFCEEKLTDEEQRIYDSYRNEERRLSDERLGKNEFSYDVLSTSRRLNRLLELGAPDVVLAEEGRTLIEAMALYRFCENMIKLIDVKP